MGATPGFFAGQLAGPLRVIFVVSVGALIFCVGSALEGGSRLNLNLRYWSGVPLPALVKV